MRISMYTVLLHVFLHDSCVFTTCPLTFQMDARRVEWSLRLSAMSSLLVAIVSSTSSSLEATQSLERLARVRALVALSPGLPRPKSQLWIVSLTLTTT